MKFRYFEIKNPDGNNHPWPTWLKIILKVLHCDRSHLNSCVSILSIANTFAAKSFAHKVIYLRRPQYNSYLGVGICNANIHSNHEENSYGDTKVSNQTTDLVREQGTWWSKSEPTASFQNFTISWNMRLILQGPGNSDHSWNDGGSTQ